MRPQRSRSWKARSILSDNGKIVINGGSVTASGGNKAITTKEEASAGNNDITNSVHKSIRSRRVTRQQNYYPK